MTQNIIDIHVSESTYRTKFDRVLNQSQAGMCICWALAIGPRFPQEFFGARLQDLPAAPFDLAANRPGEEPLDPLLYQILHYRAGIPSPFLPYPTSDGLIGIEVRAIGLGFQCANR